MITPATYNTTQICQRFGRSRRWWFNHKRELQTKQGFPKPVTYDDRLWSREEVDQWFRAGGSTPRPPRRVQPKIDDILDKRLHALTEQAEA